MSDQGVAVGQLRAFVERVERVEEEIKTLNDDKSEIYKEMRGFGFDVKAVRKVVAKRKLDPSVANEQDAVFDLYWDALTGASHVHVHEEGNSYAAEKGIDPKLAHTVVTGIQTETGRKALVAAVDIIIERDEHIDPETGEITNPVAKASEGNGTHEAHDGQGATGDASRPSVGGGAHAADTSEGVSANVSEGVTAGETAPNSETTLDPRPLTAADGQPRIPSSSPGCAKSDGAYSVVGQGRESENCITGNQEEHAVDQFTPPAFLAQKSMRDYRPHCQRPDACGGSGLKHCYSCSKLVQAESEVA